MENRELRKFANNLKLLIKQSNLSQKEFAKKVGVSATCISKWTLGQTEPTYTNIVNIIKVLKCSFEELSDLKLKLK